MSIRWEDLEPQKYENMVSVLLSRLHPIPSESMARVAMGAETCRSSTQRTVLSRTPSN